MTSTPKTLTITECHQLLAALLHRDAVGESFRKGIRNYTMTLLMLDAGLRVGEVVALEMSDLYYGGVPVENLIVRPEIAKNKRERIVPLSERIRKALTELHNECPELAERPDTGKVFRLWMHSEPITTRQVERIIRAAAMKSIGRPIHPHMLRHTFGTRIERKAGLRVAQELLGHKNVSSTQIYTHPNQQDLKNAIREICEDPQERHLLTTDSSLDAHAANGVDAPGADQDHR